MGEPLHLGNDVVDLDDPRHRGKSGDGRFLRRVFTQEERGAILDSPAPDQALWVRWAGKEAAYKTVCKARSPAPPPTFHHALFQVTVSAGGGSPVGNPAHPPAGHGAASPPRLLLRGEAPAEEPVASWSGEVTYEDQVVALRVQVLRRAVHALSWLAPNGPPPFPAVSWSYARLTEAPTWALLRSRFTEAEWSCISHPASALARLEAKRALARELRVPEAGLEIGCGPGLPGRRIPILMLDGRSLGVDLTLSHAGLFVAWAALRGPRPK